MGFSTHTHEYICTVYSKETTNITGKEVKIQRGVLQGDPLSPHLLNITLDWALTSLPTGGGARFDYENIPYVAYADDVALTAFTAAGLLKSLDALVGGVGTRLS